MLSGIPTHMLRDCLVSNQLSYVLFPGVAQLERFTALSHNKNTGENENTTYSAKEGDKT